MKFGKDYQELKKLFPKANSKKIYSLMKLRAEHIFVDKLSQLSLIVGATLLGVTYLIVYFLR